MEKDSFAARLKNLMVDAGIQSVDVVEKSKQCDPSGKGISKSSLSHYLHGRWIPKQQGIYLLSQVFDVNPLYLMCKTDDPHYDPDALAKQADTCDLIAQCFGKQAHDLVVMYLNLNDDGKAAAFERVQELTMLDKFTRKSRAVDAHTRTKSSDVA